MNDQPEWLILGESILGPLLRDVSVGIKTFSGPDFHITQLPSLALNHYAHSLQTSIETNREGRHAVAISLLRHAVEALTIIELGLVDSGFSYPLLEKWDSGKKSHGELRKALEHHVWPGYGSGLWDEPWAEYFAQWAKAVQPYAHCSPELIQWNLAAVTDSSSGRFVAGTGLYDASKASRLTLFHILAGWTLGRILFANCSPPSTLVEPSAIDALGRALSNSEFLTKGQDWSVQLWPHMFFNR
jgi:hypothetical protein